MSRRMFRQGDVLFLECNVEDVAPGTAEPRAGDGLLVVMHGESGNRHGIMEASAEIVGNADGRYLWLTQESDVTHEEHSTIHLDPGMWEVVIQHDYRRKQIERVID